MKTAKSRTRTRGRTSGTRQVVVPLLTGNKQRSVGSTSLKAQLNQILSDPDTPAAARVNAARTLAELEGRLGRHQSAPDKGTSAALSSLTRAELEGELNRLRTLFDLGLVR